MSPRTVTVNCPRCGDALEADVTESRVEYIGASQSIVEAYVTAQAVHRCSPVGVA